MVQRLGLTLFCCCFATILVAQEQIRAQLLDATTNEIIPFAGVGVPSQQRGTLTDEGGYFFLERLQLTDTVYFSALGYLTEKHSVADLKGMEQVLLRPQAYRLATITVSPGASSSSEDVVLGSSSSDRYHSISFVGNLLGSAMGTPLVVEKPTRLTGAGFVLNHARGDSLLFRLNIYDYSNGVVGKNLSPGNILIRAQQRTGRFNIDLTDHEIVVENDVFVALEWLKDYDQGGNEQISFNSVKVKPKAFPLIYYRRYNSDPFRPLNTGKKKMKLCIFLTGETLK